MSRSLLLSLVGVALLLVGAVVLGICMIETPSAGTNGGQPPDSGSGKSGTKNPDAGRESPTPALIRTLMDPGLRAEDQIEAVRSLPDDLSEREITALMALLRDPPPERSRLGTWYMLLNEVMEVLRQPRIAWPGYGEAMAELMEDRHIDPVVRDYCAQHLSQWLAHSPPGAPREAFADGMESYLRVLDGDRESFEPVSGTALMALSDLMVRRPAGDFEPYREELETIVVSYVSGGRPSSFANHISAIQAAGRMNLRGALPDIRRYAAGGTSNPSIRLSSVAALGYFSDPADQSFLEQLAQSNDRLRFAARQALENYKQ